MTIKGEVLKEVWNVCVMAGDIEYHMKYAPTETKEDVKMINTAIDLTLAKVREKVKGTCKKHFGLHTKHGTKSSLNVICDIEEELLKELRGEG